MGRPMPLFPLNMVLLPGVVLPLHVFEDRYRRLVRDLLAGTTDEPAAFGVVALRHGRETDSTSRSALYDVGCVARVRRVTELADGRFHLVTTGAERFRILALGPPEPYLVADVELFGAGDGDPAAVDDLDDALVPAVLHAFERYLHLVSADPSHEVVGAIPDDAEQLSYLVAATMALSLPDRQRLLELPGTSDRLRAELVLLDREHSLIRTLGSLPATDLTRTGFSLN